MEINHAATATATPSTRSLLLGKALQGLESMALGFPDHPAGDRDPLASEGLQAFLDQTFAAEAGRAPIGQYPVGSFIRQMTQANSPWGSLHIHGGVAQARDRHLGFCRKGLYFSVKDFIFQ